MTGPTGLLGGAFDPPHYGHVALAETAIARFALERLVVLPTGDPPHKRATAPADVRCRLAGAAFAGNPRICLSRFELDRPGPSYTVETARWAAARYGDVVVLVGADEFADFRGWKDPDEIMEHARLGVATRPGFERDRLDRVLAGLRRPERVEFFEIPAFRVSSTEIRSRVARGESIDGLVPPAVASLIRKLGVYRELDVREAGVNSEQTERTLKPH